MKPVLDAANLHKRFGGVQALRGAGVSVCIGEIVGLFGPNGAGKTTLFNMIAGTFPPDQGRILLDGADIAALPPWQRARRGLARTFQITRPFRDLSVIENVLAAQPGGPTITRPQAAALLDRVGLGPRAHGPAGALTLGMLKRLEVARALALQPRILLLDEPLAGLSERESADLLDFVVTLRAGMGVVMVEHNVRQSLPVCDRAVVMDAGAIIAQGMPDAIRTDPAVIRAYLGEDSA